MLNQTVLVPVLNISGGPVVYTIPELNVRREYSRGEKKNISVKELRALYYIPGGEVMLRNYLSVGNDELLAEFGIVPEPEYHWTDKEVRDLLLNGSLERLQDCLDYAPAGIVDLVKELAVSLKLNDMSKRQAIFEATGFNVTRAIDIGIESATEEAEVKKPAGRRVQDTASGRRVPEDTPVVQTHYKVTS